MDLRRCARPACGGPASATLTYDYGNRRVWLDSPGDEPDPSAAWGLCTPHADGLRVPRGWVTEDRRTPIFSLRPPVAV